jgi:predicted DNA-binding transcriptional regulator AlpA
VPFLFLAHDLLLLLIKTQGCKKESPEKNLRKEVNSLNQNNQYLNERQVSEITGRALSTLRNERSKRTGIPYYKVGRSVRYNFQDVIQFMESHKIIPEKCAIDISTQN